MNSLKKDSPNDVKKEVKQALKTFKNMAYFDDAQMVSIQKLIKKTKDKANDM